MSSPKATTTMNPSSVSLPSYRLAVDGLTGAVVELPEPVIRIELEEAAITSIDWANSDCLAVGTAHGPSYGFCIVDKS